MATETHKSASDDWVNLMFLPPPPKAQGLPGLPGLPNNSPTQKPCSCRSFPSRGAFQIQGNGHLEPQTARVGCATEHRRPGVLGKSLMKSMQKYPPLKK